MMNEKDRSTAIQVTQGHQLDLYPDLEIECYGTYWLNEAFDSKEYQERMKKKLFSNPIFDELK